MNAPLVALACCPWPAPYRARGSGLLLMMAAWRCPVLVVAHDYLFWGGFLPLLLMLFGSAARPTTGCWAAAPGRCRWCCSPSRRCTCPELRTLSEIAFALLASVAAWGAGRGIRRLDVQEQQLGDTLVELAEQRGAREAAALAGERSRIAAEMHDVVAHAVSLMVLQVGAARLEVETSGGPGKVATQLRSAEDSGSRRPRPAAPFPDRAPRIPVVKRPRLRCTAVGPGSSTPRSRSIALVGGQVEASLHVVDGYAGGSVAVAHVLGVVAEPPAGPAP